MRRRTVPHSSSEQTTRTMPWKGGRHASTSRCWSTVVRHVWSSWPSGPVRRVGRPASRGGSPGHFSVVKSTEDLEMQLVAGTGWCGRSRAKRVGADRYHSPDVPVLHPRRSEDPMTDRTDATMSPLAVPERGSARDPPVAAETAWRAGRWPGGWWPAWPQWPAWPSAPTHTPDWPWPLWSSAFGIFVADPHPGGGRRTARRHPDPAGRGLEHQPQCGRSPGLRGRTGLPVPHRVVARPAICGGSSGASSGTRRC